MIAYATIHDGRVAGISYLSKPLPNPPEHLIDITGEPDPDRLLGYALVGGRFEPPLAQDPDDAPTALADLWARMSDAEQDELLIGRNREARRLMFGMQIGASLPRQRLRETLAQVLPKHRVGELLSTGGILLHPAQNL